jgi:hypothetical protein
LKILKIEIENCPGEKNLYLNGRNKKADGEHCIELLLMEPEISVPYSQKPITDLYLEPGESGTYFHT